MHALTLAALVFVTLPGQGAASQPLTPAPGPHAVGMRLVQQYDYSRGEAGDLTILEKPGSQPAARPMQALVWYPAAQAKGKPVRLLDYAQTRLTEDDFSLAPADIAKASHTWTTGPADRVAAFAAPMQATRNARHAPGRFPVVVYAPSYAAPADENADLCEYLASHGYIVIASRSRGARGKVMTDDVEGLQAQAADIGFLVAWASGLPQADTDKIAAMGFSWGGLANVFAAAGSSRIKALVSLDGSVRSYPERLAEALITPVRTPVPMLSIGARSPSIEQLNERQKSTYISYLNAMKYSDVYLATMHPMAHINFAGTALRTTADSELGEFTRAELYVAYSWTARYARAFLDAYLKQDAAAMAFMKNTPRENGAPPHLMSLDARPAKAKAPTEKAFIAEFRRRKFAEAGAIYAAMRADEEKFALNPLKLNAWGYELLRDKKADGAIELFKLAIAIEPKWGGVHDSLAEAYEAIGETALAIRSYERALALDPTLASSAQRLTVLRQKAAKG